MNISSSLTPYRTFQEAGISFHVIDDDSESPFLEGGVGSMRITKKYPESPIASEHYRLFQITEETWYIVEFDTLEEAQAYIATLKELGPGKRTDTTIVPVPKIYFEYEGVWNVAIKVEYGLLGEEFTDKNRYRGMVVTSSPEKMLLIEKSKNAVSKLLTPESTAEENESAEKIFSRKVWNILQTVAPNLVEAINKENRRFEHAEIEAALDAETLRKITALIREYNVWDEYTPTMSIPNEDGTRFLQIYDDATDTHPTTDGLCLMVHKQSV